MNHRWSKTMIAGIFLLEPHRQGWDQAPGLVLLLAGALLCAAALSGASS